MTKGLIFWVIMIIWAVFGVARYRIPNNESWVWGGDVIEFILFFLIGWTIYGFVVQ